MIKKNEIRLNIFIMLFLLCGCAEADQDYKNIKIEECDIYASQLKKFLLNDISFLSDLQNTDSKLIFEKITKNIIDELDEYTRIFNECLISQISINKNTSLYDYQLISRELVSMSAFIVNMKKQNNSDIELLELIIEQIKNKYEKLFFQLQN